MDNKNIEITNSTLVGFVLILREKTINIDRYIESSQILQTATSSPLQLNITYYAICK